MSHRHNAQAGARLDGVGPVGRRGLTGSSERRWRPVALMAASALALTSAVVAPRAAVALAPQEELKLTASDAAAGDWFGGAVAVDGDTIVVGARRDDDGGSDSGSAYVFGSDGVGGYAQQAKLIADDAAAGDDFGNSVAVAGDTIVVGAPFDTSGSVYVFGSDGFGGYAQQAKLIADDAAAGDDFGNSVALAGDTIVVGAPDDDDAGYSSGSVYVFGSDGFGGYAQQAKLTADDAAGGDNFGHAVALAGDTIVVGARGDDDGGSFSGSVYVFGSDGFGGYAQQAKLTADDAAGGDNFGHAVAVAGDTIVVGAPFDWSAYVFGSDGSGGYPQQAKLTAPDAPDAAGGDVDFDFGWSVAVVGDTIVVGATGDDDGGSSSGSAYVFGADGSGGWAQEAKLTASDAAAGDVLGSAVAVAGDTIVVGASGDDNAGSADLGSAYVYQPATPVIPAAPPAPTVATCEADGVFSPPAAQVGVIWTVDPAGQTGPGTYTVTAAPAQGYYLPAGTQTTWKVTVAAKLTEGCTPPVTPPVVTPPTDVGKAVTVQVRAVSGGKKLYVNVNPDKGGGYWQFAVQKLTVGKWRTRSKVYKTWGKNEIRRLRLSKGTYRVTVLPRYGYAGATSQIVSLRSAQSPTVVYPDRGIATSAEVRAVSGKSKLHVDVNPNMGSGYWQFTVQKLTKGKWRALPTVYKTKNRLETRRLNLKRGTYRVIVMSRYGYEGGMSDTVWLRR